VIHLFHLSAYGHKVNYLGAQRSLPINNSVAAQTTCISVENPTPPYSFVNHFLAYLASDLTKAPKPRIKELNRVHFPETSVQQVEQHYCKTC
jgi:hypothetical protein